MSALRRTMRDRLAAAFTAAVFICTAAIGFVCERAFARIVTRHVPSTAVPERRDPHAPVAPTRPSPTARAARSTPLPRSTARVVVPTALDGLRARVARAWPGDDAWAFRIIGGPTRKCPTGESGWNPREIHTNADGSTDWGLFQLHREDDHEAIARSFGFVWADMLKPEPNVRVAWRIYQLEGPRAWACNA